MHTIYAGLCKKKNCSFPKKIHQDLCEFDNGGLRDKFLDIPQEVQIAVVLNIYRSYFVFLNNPKSRT